jgi:hypothetical protein
MTYGLTKSFVAALAMAGLMSSTALAQPYQPGPPGPPPHGNRPPPSYPGSPPPPPLAWHNGGYYHGNRHYADWQHYHLRRPPQGYQWVQTNNQFLLIQISNGIIIDIH